MEGLDEIISEFLVESYESLDQLDRDLMALEDAPQDRDRLDSIFRTVHSIKGTSGFLALPKLEKVAHVGENLLVPLREGTFDLTNDIADGLLGMVDAIRSILAEVEANGVEGDEEYASLIAQLDELKLSSLGKSATETDEPVAAIVSDVAETPEESPPEPEAPKPIDVPESADAPAVQPAATTAKPMVKESSPGDESGARQTPSLADSSVRIDVALLDKLMNLVGELVLSRNQILQFAEGSKAPAIVATSQRLNLITTELQAGVMKTRMQPIRNAWSKLPRVVRDLSNNCGKQVDVVMEGSETELDKTILEAIKDPLTHIVRNSVDHGIEPSDVRVANGKSANGTLWLRAYHESGQVNIEIADDGGGINLDRVREKAVERGLITAEQAAELSDREAVRLILLPGFSTAAQVTNVSGRGVGMDVVKTNVEKIGGTLEIDTDPGNGTTLRIKIPLTLAIIPALIVTSNGDRFAIPQVSLVELIRLTGEQMTRGIEYVQGAPVYRLRGQLLPLVYLSETLGVASAASRSAEGTEHRTPGGALNFDFIMARSRHLAWKEQLHDYAAGNGAFDKGIAVSADTCYLGKWLQRESHRDSTHVNRISKLEHVHTKLHDVVERIVHKYQLGDTAGANLLLKSFDALSLQMMDMMEELKETAECADATNILVLRANDRQYGLIVDQVNDSAEIVVKPLSRQLKDLAEYAGTTIMGDGTVALILDVTGIAMTSGLTADVQDLQAASGLEVSTDDSGELQTLLVVDLGDSRQFALPTSMVARLERIACSALEFTDGRRGIQYRGDVLPIVSLDDIFGGDCLGGERDEVQIVVYSEGDFSCGFLVNSIVDIVDTEFQLQSDVNHTENLLGTTVIHDRVTDVLNLRSLARH